MIVVHKYLVVSMKDRIVELMNLHTSSRNSLMKHFN